MFGNMFSGRVFFVFFFQYETVLQILKRYISEEMRRGEQQQWGVSLSAVAKETSTFSLCLQLTGRCEEEFLSVSHWLFTTTVPRWDGWQSQLWSNIKPFYLTTVWVNISHFTCGVCMIRGKQFSLKWHDCLIRKYSCVPLPHVGYGE